MSTLSQFLGGGAYVPNVQRHYVSSGTFVAPRKGKIAIMAVGAGGAGATYIAGGGAYVKCSGGGAGAVAYDFLSVNASDTFTITIGAGGVSTINNTSLAQAGVAGTSTTITGPSAYSLTVGGGGAGNVVDSSATGVAGGAGGTATGGSSSCIKYAGGRGGDISYTGGGSGNYYGSCTGGGGVNLFGLTAQTGTRGGDLPTAPTTKSAGAGWLATGGGGIGGTGGDITYSLGSSQGASSGGGGSLGSANTISSNNVGIALVKGFNNYLHVVRSDNLSPNYQCGFYIPIFNIDVSGQGAGENVSGPGGGGRGTNRGSVVFSSGVTSIPYLSSSSSDFTATIHGGIFGGSGGVSYYEGFSSMGAALDDLGTVAGLGGGGGGVHGSWFGSSTAPYYGYASSVGGNGFVSIVFFAEL